MNPSTPRMRGLIWAGLGLLAIAVGVCVLPSRPAGRSSALPVLGHVTGFHLTNQLDQPISFSDLTGRVWVADIIFTRCPGPCLKMTRELAEVQAALPKDTPVRLVSLTADPGFDTPEVLEKYADRFGAAADRWLFLSGSKPEVYSLALKQLLLAVDETEPGERTNDADLFVHSTRFVVVDTRGQVRGVFEGTDPESRPKLLAAVRGLLGESKP